MARVGSQRHKKKIMIKVRDVPFCATLN